MNAKELMIGDFVKFSRVEEVVPYMRIVSIDEGYIRCYDGGFFTFNPNDVDPIPLTHEILVKNGLMECFDGAIEYEYFPEDKTGLLEITEENGEVWWTINVAEYRIAKLEYVHQLQHAIRLLGIDKDIIL